MAEGNQNITIPDQQVLLRDKLKKSSALSMQAATDINNLESIIQALKGQLAISTDSSPEAIATNQSINNQLKVAYAEIGQIWDQHELDKSLAVNEVQAGIATETATDVITDFHNKALEIEAFLTVNEVTGLSDSYIGDLAMLAPLCAYEHGHPVYLARSILAQLGGPDPATYLDRHICNPIKAREQLGLQNVELELYPNPSNGILFVSYPELNEGTSINILNVNGKLVKSLIPVHNKGTLEIDLRTLQSGLYFLVVETPSGLVQKKFIKFE